MEADFFDEVCVVVEFRREGVQLRYCSRIRRGRPTLSQGPAGLVDVSSGLAAAAGDIDAAFAKITAFVDRSESLLRRSCWPPDGPVRSRWARLSARPSDHEAPGFAALSGT
jgi:hypothetical protein